MKGRQEHLAYHFCVRISTLVGVFKNSVSTITLSIAAEAGMRDSTSAFSLVYIEL